MYHTIEKEITSHQISNSVIFSRYDSPSPILSQRPQSPSVLTIVMFLDCITLLLDGPKSLSPTASPDIGPGTLEMGTRNAVLCLPI